MPRQKIIALTIFFIINFFFFASFYLKGLLPFPGDLLLAEYNPFRQYSFFGFAPGGIPHKAQSFDTLRQLYPWRFLAINLLKKGQWPLWNPYNFSGSPLLANFQAAPFYPLNFLYWFFPFNFAWAIQVILQPLLASFFTYLLLRKWKASFLASLFAGLTFAYGSFMTVWLEYNTIGHVILWLPLIILASELIREKFSFWRASLLIWALAFSFLAGHFQDFAFVWFFSLIFFLWRKQRRWLSLLWILPFFLVAIQFLPGLELIRQSARSALPKDFLQQKVLLQPTQLIVLLIPDFFGNPATRNYFWPDTYIGKVLYIGILPMLLAIFAFKNRSQKIKFFLIAIIVSLFLSLATPLSRLIYSLPFFSSLSPTRVLFIFQFCLSLLAGFGLDYWQKKKSLIDLKIIIPVGLIFFFAWLAVLIKPTFLGATFLVNLNVVRRNLLYSSGLFLIALILLVLSRKKKKAFLYLMIIFTVFDLFRFFRKITPFSPRESVFPSVEIIEILQKRPGRFWGYGTAAIDTNYNLIYGLSSPNGYDPLYPFWYGEYLRLSEEGIFKPAIRSDAAVASGFGKTDFSQNKFRQKILAGLSVNSLLDREENQTDQTTFSAQDYPLVWQGDGWRIYDNQKSAPRAFFAQKVFFASNKKDFENIFQRPDFWPDNQVILNKNLQKEDWLEGKAKIISYEEDLVKIETENREAGILVLTDTYFPGWQVLVDGRKTEIWQANYALRAVLVPAGTHQVQFIFRPLSFVLGFCISAISLLTWLLSAILSIINFKKRKK